MSEPKQKSFHIRRGTKFGPVVIYLGPMQSGASVDIADAFIRLKTSTGSRDSTVDNGEIVIDDEALTVTWTMLEDATAELSVGNHEGQLTVIDGDGEDRDPLTIDARIMDRVPAPA